MFSSCCVPLSKNREMETRCDCARRRRVGLAADTQFVVKLSGDCRGKWLDIRFGVVAVRCTSKRERFVAAVVDLVNSHTLAKGYGPRWCLLQYRTYTTKRRGRTPIPYIHDCEVYSHISREGLTFYNVFSKLISIVSYEGIFPLVINR